MGPYIDAPVIAHILAENLNTNQTISELQMINLRHIVEANPEARTDFSVLTDLLRRNGGSGQGQQA
jgi:hypothetical protein